MSIFKTAYDTTACSGMRAEKLNKIKNAILEAHVLGDLSFGELPETFLIKGNRNSIATIEAFVHPMAVHFRGNNSDSLVSDVRDYLRFDPTTSDYKIVAPSDYTLATTRLGLNHIWLEPTGVAQLRDMPSLAIQVYTAWISQAVARRMNLDQAEQLKLAMYTAYFYCTLFIEKSEEGQNFSSEEAMRITSMIIAATRCKPQDAANFIQEMEEYTINTIIDFCANAHQVIGTIRLREFNHGLLMAILGGSWFGTYAKELLAVSLEHPPTWLAILMMACGDRKYKKAPLTIITEVWAKRGMDADYVRLVKSLVNDKY